MTAPEQLPLVVGLDDEWAADVSLVGGKAEGLHRLIRAGFSVPPGFVITTAAYAAAGDRVMNGSETGPDRSISDGVWEAIESAYRSRGMDEIPVAVRSSSTAEDLPGASFAGQYDTYLNICGLSAIVDAVRMCWASLWAGRAAMYRAQMTGSDQSPTIAVIVQHLVGARSAGVMHTVNPISGNVTEFVIEATAGLGEPVVSGTIVPDHYTIARGGPVTTAGGVLTSHDLRSLQRAGSAVHDASGGPQDVEWAIDYDDTLWLLQARPITTVFPTPVHADDAAVRAYWSVNIYQGLSQPLTPLGIVALRRRQASMASYLSAIGFAPAIEEADGWLYWDITDGLTDPAKLTHVVTFTERIASPSGQIIEHLARDPRFTTRRGEQPQPQRQHRRHWIRIVAAWLFPRIAHSRARRGAERILAAIPTPDQRATPNERLRFVQDYLDPICHIESRVPRWANTAGTLAQDYATRLLSPVAAPNDLTGVFRGVPDNPTTQMDLRLWSIAQHISQTAGNRRDTGDDLDPAAMTQTYLDRHCTPVLTASIMGEIDEFLADYGCRVAAEMDLGLPRWSEQPEAVFRTLISYAKAISGGSDAHAHFAAADAAAKRQIAQLVSRLPRTQVLRRITASYLLHRARRLRGLRELPKLYLMRGYAILRSQLLHIAADLDKNGLLDNGSDVAFLNLDEVRAALGGADHRALIRARQRRYTLESARRRVPAVVLSDGTVADLPPAATNQTDTAQQVLRGMPGASGIATGRARIVRSAATATINPGEILVCPSTDPGWTPLFLNAAALVAESGGVISHGTTIAREYGIPAVVGVNHATERITDGDLVTVDGARGTITVNGRSDPDDDPQPSRR